MVPEHDTLGTHAQQTDARSEISVPAVKIVCLLILSSLQSEFTYIGGGDPEPQPVARKPVRFRALQDGKVRKWDGVTPGVTPGETPPVTPRGDPRTRVK